MSFNRKYIILERITISSDIISKFEYQSNGTATWLKKKKYQPPESYNPNKEISNSTINSIS